MPIRGTKMLARKFYVGTLLDCLVGTYFQLLPTVNHFHNQKYTHNILYLNLKRNVLSLMTFLKFELQFTLKKKEFCKYEVSTNKILL